MTEAGRGINQSVMISAANIFYLWHNLIPRSNSNTMLMRFCSLYSQNIH